MHILFIGIFALFASVTYADSGCEPTLRKVPLLSKDEVKHFKSLKRSVGDRKALEAAQAKKTAVDLSLVVDQFAND